MKKIVSFNSFLILLFFVVTIISSFACFNVKAENKITKDMKVMFDTTDDNDLIVKMLKLQDNTIKLLIEATDKVKINSVDMSKPYLTANIEVVNEDLDFANQDVEILTKAIANSFSRYAKLNKEIMVENIGDLTKIDNPMLLIDTVVMSLNVKVDKKQDILDSIYKLEKKCVREMILKEHKRVDGRAIDEGILARHL